MNKGRVIMVMVIHDMMIDNILFITMIRFTKTDKIISIMCI